MSGAGGLNIGAARTALGFQVALGGDAFDALRQWPQLTAGAMNLRLYDYITHHRRGVGKDAAASFPAGRQGQKFVFAFYRRYGRSPDPGNPISRIASGAVAADRLAGAEGLGEGVFANLESGRRIAARGFMLIPFPGALNAAAGRLGLDGSAKRLTQADWNALRERKNLVLIKRPGGVLLIGRRTGVTAKKDTEGRSVKLLAILTRNRTQRPLLGFFARAESLVPYHLAKIERNLAAIAEQAGRVGVARQIGVAVGKGVLPQEDTWVRSLRKSGQLLTADNAERRALTRRGEALARASAAPEPDAGRGAA